MSRQLDAASENRASKRRGLLACALDGGLDNALQAQGALMTGFSVRYEEFETLMTLRAIVGEVKSVSFVGAETLTGVFIKAEREAKRGTLRWKEDKWRENGG